MTEEVLTLELLDKAIEQINQFEVEHEIIGYVLNPSDMEDIRNGDMRLVTITNKKLMVSPPYRGLKLFESDLVPPGYPQPIRMNDTQVTMTSPESHNKPC